MVPVLLRHGFRCHICYGVRGSDTPTQNLYLPRHAQSSVYTWWDNVDYFLKFIRPMYEMIRIGDKDVRRVCLKSSERY